MAAGAANTSNANSFCADVNTAFISTHPQYQQKRGQLEWREEESRKQLHSVSRQSHDRNVINTQTPSL